MSAFYRIFIVEWCSNLYAKIRSNIQLEWNQRSNERKVKRKRRRVGSHNRPSESVPLSLGSSFSPHFRTKSIRDTPTTLFEESNSVPLTTEPMAFLEEILMAVGGGSPWLWWWWRLLLTCQWRLRAGTMAIGDFKSRYIEDLLWSFSKKWFCTFVRSFIFFFVFLFLLSLFLSFFSFSLRVAYFFFLPTCHYCLQVTTLFE